MEAITDHATLRKVYFALLERLQPTVCCDIGANDGQAALLAQTAAPSSAVYAFEANPEVHARNVERLRAHGMQYLHLAIADRAGEVSVFAPRTLSKSWTPDGLVDAAISESPETGKTSLLLRNEDATYAEFKVPAQTLDGFFRGTECNVAASSFALWIDVEGAAYAVLAGATEVLRSTVAIFIEVEGHAFWRDQQTSADVIALLETRGFVPVARDREYGDDQFNILFVRPEYRSLAVELVTPSYPQSDLPVLIPTFNNPTYLRSMIAQLRHIGLTNITVVDNASRFPPLLEYFEELATEITIVRQPQNYGPRHLFLDSAFYESLPQFFAITDPDLEFNPDLPADFVAHLSALTERHRIGKAGFSLDISEPVRMQPQPFVIAGEQHRIWEWEAQFWKTRVESEGEDPAYRALIDTTFAIYNREYFRAETHLDAIRVAGRFTARHLPWYIDHQLPSDEAAFYRAASKHSFYAGESPDSVANPE